LTLGKFRLALRSSNRPITWKTGLPGKRCRRKNVDDPSPSIIIVPLVRASRLMPLARAAVVLPGLMAAAAMSQPLAGRIVGSNGRAADAAFVSVMVRQTFGGDHVVASTRSETDGNFSLNLPASTPGSQIELFADIPGVGMTRPLTLDSAASAPLTLCPTTRLHLSFVGPDGSPAAGIAVRPTWVRWDADSVPTLGTLSPSSSLPTQIARRWEKRADKDGAINFIGFPANSAVGFEAEDDRFVVSSSDRVEITADQSVSKTIHLLAAAKISGAVTYSDSGKPAANLRVDVRPAGALNVGEAVTDAAGHFEFNRLSPAPYFVALDSDNRLRDWIAAAALVTAKPAAENRANLSLVHGAIVTGKVRDNVTGKGFAGLNVEWYGPGYPGIASPPSIQIDTTDADGTFTLRVPPGQSFNLATDPPEGYLRPPATNVHLGEGETVTWNLDLPRDHSPLVEGRVIDSDGNPVAGATVITTGRTVQTDATGRFHLHAPSGTLLRARFKDMATKSAVKTGGAGSYTLTVAANMTFDLHVTVVDANGSPVPDSTLLIGESGIMMASRKVPADGVVKFDSLNSDTQWFIMAEAQGYRAPGASVHAPDDASPRQAQMTIRLKKTG